MGTGNGWCVVGVGEVGFQSMGKMVKGICPNFLQPPLENFVDGGRELIQKIHKPHRKRRPFSLAVPRTLDYLLGVPSNAAPIGRAFS